MTMDTATPPRLVPTTDDLDTGEFFAAAGRGELVVRRCRDCVTALHVPRMYCRHCRSWNGDWQVIDGAATLYSWTVVTHQVHPAYPTPYTVVIVALDADPDLHFAGRLDGSPELRAGMPMDIWFETLDDQRNAIVPNWRPRQV
jgi:uncharacterized OB-fold protein